MLDTSKYKVYSKSKMHTHAYSKRCLPSVFKASQRSHRAEHTPQSSKHLQADVQQPHSSFAIGSLLKFHEGGGANGFFLERKLTLYAKLKSQ